MGVELPAPAVDPVVLSCTFLPTFPRKWDESAGLNLTSTKALPEKVSYGLSISFLSTMLFIG